MKLTCHRPTLANALSVVSGVVPTRTPQEILKNIKLQLRDGSAFLIGTNMEVSIRHAIPEVTTDEYGEALLPTHRVQSILREAQDDEIEFDISDDAIMVRSGHAEFRLSAEDPAEFPTVAEFEEEAFFAIPGGRFREMIRRTVFATDPESARYALGGVLMELDGETVTMAATDSRRLAVVESSGTVEGTLATETAPPVIPAKALTLVERSLGADDEQVKIAIRQNDVVITTEGSTIFSRLVDGRFPRYRDVIPSESTATATLLAGPFLSAVRQAMIVTNEESRGVDFTFSEGTLTLSSQASDVGESKIDMPIDYDGDELVITFEPRFLVEFLRVLEPETKLAISLIDSESAAVARTEDQYTYVIMPLSRER